MQQNITWLFFSAFLFAASASDVRHFRLPNWLMGLGLVTGVSLSSFFGGLGGLELSLLGVLSGLLPSFVLFALGYWKAGDTKFLAAIGSFVGPEGAIVALLFGTIAGGVLSGVSWLTAKPTEDRMKKKVPYGVALAVGAVIAVLRCGFVGGVV
jgi:Flp pilus assembly protein protease CpaA